MREFKFKIGDIVYLVTDIDNMPYMITGIVIRSKGIMYLASRASENEIEFNEFEFSETKTVW